MKEIELTAKSAKSDNTFCPKLAFKNRYITSKMDQLVGFLLRPPTF